MRRAALLATLAFALPATAHAADPGLWIKTATSSKPSSYRQGLASNPATGDVFFSGPFVGVYRTRNDRVLVSNGNAIPQDVNSREQYNHIGDIAFDARDGGQVLLPMESYQPFQPDTNPSKTGSIGVLDAKTLSWKYYVKLDPAEIPKAQWIATDPANNLFWTISGQDLLAYRLSDINPANAAPNAPPIHSVRRLSAVAPHGAGGAVVFRGRIYLSTQTGDVDQIVSVDPNSGASRVEFQLPGTAEPEGLDVGPYMNGLLHWELVPGGGLSNVEVVNLVPKGAHLRLRLNHARVRAGRKVRVSGTVRVIADGFAIPVPKAELTVAAKSARTYATGFAELAVELTRGRYRAQAFFPGLRTATRRIRAI